MLKFGLVGVGGFVASRHMEAIKLTGNKMIASLDPNDSVGIIDSYFPESRFLPNLRDLIDTWIKLREIIIITKLIIFLFVHLITCMIIHIRFSLRSDANVICEKPLVLNPWNIDALKSIEKDTGKKINTILQLRLHKNIIKLKKEVKKNNKKSKFDVDLTYITSRGNWYLQSWKGDDKKSNWNCNKYRSSFLTC